MKLRRILPVMLPLLIPWHAHSEAAVPVWSIDPAVPGPDLPGSGASLFDLITRTADGSQLIPFPFTRLIARFEAAAGCNEASPCTRAVLIPLGRSLQRVAASPAFYRHPRVVATVVSDGRGPFLLRDRLYVGYQDKAGVIEVISYNETLGRFEFQIVRDYVEGRTPQVSYARRTVCLSCHQNHGPIFSRQVWLETNANPQIAARLAQEQPAFHGVAARGASDVANAIDDASDRSNQLALVQRLWTDGCGAAASGMKCRRAALLASLQFVLTGQRSYDATSAEFRASVSDTLARNARTQWPAGIAVPNPDIPNRDPLALPAGTMGLALAHVAARFDPLSPRAPLEVLSASGDLLSDQLVKGIATFWSTHSRDQLDRAVEDLPHAAVRRLKAPCRVTNVAEQIRFSCNDTASPDRLQLSGGLTRTTGALDSLGVGAAEPLRHLQLNSISAQIDATSGSATFVPRDQGKRTHLQNGRTVQQIALHWSKGEGAATILVREDFAAIESAVSEEVASGTVLRSSLIDAIAARAAGSQPASCCAQPVRAAGVADEYVPATAAMHPAALVLESQCGSCHHTAEAAPPNFLSGDTRRISLALEHCAPRIFVRLAMRDLPPQQRDKTPMPPELFSMGHSSESRGERSLAAVRSSIEGLLRKEYGRVPTVDELLQHGYESLRPCLPPAG